jgi:hypothetical protein
MENETIKSKRNYYKIFTWTVIVIAIVGGLYFGLMYLLNNSYTAGYEYGVKGVINSQVNQSVLYYFDNTTIKYIGWTDLCSELVKK